jgi:hypothetical protein
MSYPAFAVIGSNSGHMSSFSTVPEAPAAEIVQLLPEITIRF